MPRAHPKQHTATPCTMTRATVGDDGAHAPNPARRGGPQPGSFPPCTVCLLGPPLLLAGKELWRNFTWESWEILLIGLVMR